MSTEALLLGAGLRLYVRVGFLTPNVVPKEAPKAVGKGTCVGAGAGCTVS
ncbi:MAG: hypothetical protein ABR867_03755 [Nitrososphaerales archaeon]